VKKKIIAVVAVAALAAAGGWAWRSKSKRASRERGAAKVEVKRQAIEDAVDATGSVLPLNRVEIKPPISGRIEKLVVDEGQSVRPGQTVAWMSSNDRAAILDAARAKGPEELKRWEDAYKPTPIVASLPGVVILRNAVVGQTVSASEVVYAVADTLIVQAQVDESEIGKVRRGMPAKITLDAYPDQTVDAEVFDILYEGKSVSNVVTYGVKVRPVKVPDFFRSQMTANVSFIVGRKEDALVVPSFAVKESTDGLKQVLVRAENGKPETRVVKTGIESGESVEILEGVKEGETLLARQERYSPQAAPASSPLSMGGARGGMRGGGGGARSSSSGGSRRAQ
jgi:membrane fusion protein, macrolide-specific efflux system